jgi:demethylmenaquinone methyltransferase/2-methoxy-6-polyprenyl-1,4-benzoquinol methylase/phosphoethanolamine N-methyltransferase
LISPEQKERKMKQNDHNHKVSHAEGHAGQPRTVASFIGNHIHQHPHQQEDSAPITEGHTIRWASLYDAITNLLMFLLGGRTRPETATLKLAQLKPGDKVLDVGCGTGKLAISAAGQVGPAGEVHGIDAAPEMIDVARQKAAHGNVGVAFQVGLVEDIPFPDDHFDSVLSSLMVHHLPGDKLKLAAFREIRRVLKPGGRLLFVDFEPPTNRPAKAVTTMLVGHGMMRNNVQTVIGLVEAAGFTELSAGRTGHKALSFVSGIAGLRPHPVAD